MGKIMYKDIPFSGTFKMDHIELTQLDYDALSAEEKNDPNKVYFVRDADPSETSELLDIMYPIGSYYETADVNFDPNLTWGGNWISETITDNKIVEEGASGIWTYRKWSSGLAECWGYKTTTGTFAAWATNCYSHTIPAEAYPSNLFDSSPVCVANARSTSADTVCGPSASGGGNASHTPTIALIRPTNATGTLTFQAWYHATGTWKTYNSPYPIYKWTRLN